MNFLTWFDNRTILAYTALVAAAFGAAILSIRYTYPHLRGAFAVGCGFLTAVPATLLIAARGIVPNILSVVFGNILVFVCYFMALFGLLRYFGQKGRLVLAVGWTTLVVGSCALFYYGAIDDRIVPRIVTCSIVIAILRVLVSIAILRSAYRDFQRKLFVLAMVLFAAVSASRVPLTLIHGAPPDYLHRNAVQTYNLLFGVFTIFLDGLFFFTLFVFEVTRTSTQRAIEDSLTGVLNRRAIEDKLNEELARTARSGRVVSVLLIDIDHFKTVNDTLGHAAGDQALKLVSKAIAATLRPFDHLGRFGGDEFLLILPELRLADALVRAEFLRQALAPTSAPTLSIGIAESEPGESTPVLLSRADQALYRAKNAGRDCIRLQPADEEHSADQNTLS